MAIRKRTWVSNGEIRTAWVVDYFGNDIDAATGKRRRHIKTFARKKEADKEWERISGEVRQGIHVPNRQGLTVRQACDIWLKACERGRDGGHSVEPHTLRQYDSHVRHINPLIGDRRISELTEPVIRQF